MFAYQCKENNDIFVILNNSEVEKLKTDTICGLLIDIENQEKVIGTSEIKIDTNYCRQKMEITVSDMCKSEDEKLNYIGVSIMDSGYQYIIERGRFESHEGWSHTHVENIDKMELFLSLEYKRISEKLKKN